MSEDQKQVYIAAFAAAFTRQLLDRQAEGRGDAGDDERMDGYAEEADFIGKEAARRIQVPTTLEGT